MCKKGVNPVLKIVIEHLEDGLWTWIYLEYENISRFLGRDKIIFTNIKNEGWRRILSSLGEVWSDSILEYPHLDKLIILDPVAEKTLEPDHVGSNDLLVIGGILGDYPPRKRTYKYLTSKLLDKDVRIYNLGDKIFPIDSAALVAYMIASGKRLDEIEVLEGLEIPLSGESALVLPFAYPVIEGKPFIHPRLLELLKKEEPLTTGSSIWLEEYLNSKLDNDLNV